MAECSDETYELAIPKPAAAVSVKAEEGDNWKQAAGMGAIGAFMVVRGGDYCGTVCNGDCVGGWGDWEVVWGSSERSKRVAVETVLNLLSNLGGYKELFLAIIDFLLVISSPLSTSTRGFTYPHPVDLQ